MTDYIILYGTVKIGEQDGLQLGFSGKTCIVTGAAKRTTLGRLAEAEEQARVIAFMLSDAASYMNGACLDSNGGSVML